jgi:hypothetical protein
MNNIIKPNVLIIFLIIVFLFMCVKSCNEKKEISDSYNKAILLKEQQIKSYKDDSGRTHVTVIEQENSLAVLHALYANTIDSTAKLLKIKDDRIKELVKISFQSDNAGIGYLSKDTILIHDTLNGQPHISFDTSKFKLNVADNYLTFRAIIDKNNHYSWNYDYKDTLNYVSYIKKYGFLNLKSETIIDISMGNKNSKVTGVTQIKVLDFYKPKHFSVGPYVGYGLNGYQIGVGIQYKLFDF